MTFKEYKKWCNERACDGCWGLIEAMSCIELYQTIEKLPFWKREKIWKEKYEQQVLYEIVNPINEMIQKQREEMI